MSPLSLYKTFLVALGADVLCHPKKIDICFPIANFWFGRLQPLTQPGR
jgi:hypothetical protein